MRLLNAGKMLFARHGYEQTSTAAIAREAGSSESQLIRYFGGKAGLLEAIFNDSWSGLNLRVEPILTGAQHGREGILRLLAMMVRALGPVRRRRRHGPRPRALAAQSAGRTKPIHGRPDPGVLRGHGQRPRSLFGV